MQQWETPAVLAELKYCKQKKHWCTIDQFAKRNCVCSNCISYISAKKKAYRLRDPETTRARERAYTAKWREKHGDRAVIASMLSAAKHRAAQKAVPFDITLSDVVIPKNCPILGLELTRNRGCPGDASPSIDRIVPSLGYVKDNIAVISNRANVIKNSGTASEHEAIAKWIRANGGE